MCGNSVSVVENRHVKLVGMTTKQLIRANLDSARTQLAETFPRLKDGMLDWAPSPGMHSVHRILMDIITTEQVITDGLRGLPLKTDEELDEPLLRIRTVRGLVKALTDVREETLQYLESVNKAQLDSPALNSAQYEKRLELLARYQCRNCCATSLRHESYTTPASWCPTCGRAATTPMPGTEQDANKNNEFPASQFLGHVGRLQ